MAAPTSAAERFAAISEMVLALAEQVEGAAETGKLRLVSRRFSDIVSCVQFRRLTVTSFGFFGGTRVAAHSGMHIVGFRMLTEITNAPWLSCVRELRLDPYDEEVDERVLRTVLGQMGGLRTSHWREGLLAKDSISTLRDSCPRLNTLEIEFLDRLSAHKGFFPALCEKYRDTGAQPLRLSYIQFGRSIIPPEAETMDKLIDASYLKEISFFYVGPIRTEQRSMDDVDLQELYHPGGTGNVVPFHDFGPSRFPNLRRFAVNVCDEAVERFFMANPTFTRQLAVVHFPVGVPAVETMKVQFRMLRLDPSSYRGSSFRTELGAMMSCIAFADPGVLEGLDIVLKLNHLRNSAKTWGWCFSLRNVKLVCRYLPKLTSLTQLRIQSDQTRKYNIESQKRLSKIARRLASASTTLRHVQLQGKTFRVRRPLGAPVSVEPVLDKAEIDEVELFKFMEDYSRWPI
ncbi:hypothetical protein QBC34DRAFT_477534 [Podospora aff. communis PSN243]|uniref:F-box domain-containing protein n=1 Tax=Podospora aff. communis PSN243 TaxID=3040156 RepID=A0AAV9G5Z2_9PEZI|nr:hypothetical protein QBC34DRAFT_477534 [Podospora aff. communis PSN243]